MRNFSFARKSPKSSTIPKTNMMSPATMMGRNVSMAKFDWVLRKRQTDTANAVTNATPPNRGICPV